MAVVFFLPSLASLSLLAAPTLVDLVLQKQPAKLHSPAGLTSGAFLSKGPAVQPEPGVCAVSPSLKGGFRLGVGERRCRREGQDRP